MTNRRLVGPYKAWVTSPLHMIGRGYKTVWGGYCDLVLSWPLVRDNPRVSTPVAAGRPKSKKRRADDPFEDKTEVLEEGELDAAWLLNEMDQATQADPIPYVPVD